MMEEPDLSEVMPRVIVSENPALLFNNTALVNLSSSTTFYSNKASVFETLSPYSIWTDF
jgi:hypothetical protein